MLARSTYPIYHNKHLEDALFSAAEFINWKKITKSQKNNPKKYVLVYYPELIDHFKKKYKPKQISWYRLITIYRYKDVGVVHLLGIGSPHASTILEELIALGGKEFLNIGSAGGLDGFGFHLCTKAIRDEGTSYHYIPRGMFTYPDTLLTKKFESCLKKNKIHFSKSTTWTIDAPYRETKTEIKHYKKLGVKTVEMEASALFAVAKVRKVKIASAFVVSDILGEEKWDPQFNAKHVKQNLKQLFDIAVECLLQK